jgi:hypothetical protein
MNPRVLAPALPLLSTCSMPMNGHFYEPSSLALRPCSRVFIAVLQCFTLVTVLN